MTMADGPKGWQLRDQWDALVRGEDCPAVNSIGGFSIFLAGKAAGVRPSTQGGTSRLRA